MLNQVAAALVGVHGALADIAAKHNQTVKAVTIGVKGTAPGRGVVTGTVTVNNRSRRPFTLTADAGGVVLKFYGEEKRLAA